MDVEEELKKCKEKLEFYRWLNKISDKCETSIQDFPFKETDKLLAKKYFNKNENLLENALYKFLHFDRNLQEEGILQNNSIDIYLPPIHNLDELKKLWKISTYEERIMYVKEYLKLIIFSHHFKIKQLIGSLFYLVNTRSLLSVVLICRALFEHIAVLNSYYEFYKVIVKKDNLKPTFQQFKNGKIIKGELSESFKKPFEALKREYQGVVDLSKFIFCAFGYRYLRSGFKDLSLYEKCNNHWLNVFENKEKLEFEDEKEILKLPSVTLDITFLENKIRYAKKWYSIICEFVHPNSGSHRTVIFEKTYATRKENELIEMPAFESLKEKDQKILQERFNILAKYKLCSVANYDIKQNYAFIVEASYYPLVELIRLSIDIINDVIKEL